MIAIGIPAQMRCDGEDCPQTLEADLCLLATGGFGFRGKGPPEVLADWQVGVAKNGAFVCYCPAHKREVSRIQVPPVDSRLQVGPRGVRVKNGG